VDGYAADEWRRVAPELYRLGLLSMLDTGPFAAYCVAYQHWRTAEEVLSNDDHPLDAADQRRLTRIAANAARDMIKYASEFGMTPAARSRLAGVVAKPAGGKFDGLIG
jgi:P27 family predicted phage terminase small subunit